jgi:hypothetical protein
MLTVNQTLITPSTSNARFTVSFSLDSGSQTQVASGVDSYKVRIDMASLSGLINPSSVKVLGDTSFALFSVDQTALSQGIFSVAALAPTGERLSPLQPIVSFEVNQTELAPATFTVKELTINGANLLAGATTTSLPVAFGPTVDRVVPSSAGANGLYEAGGNLVIAPGGFLAGRTLLEGSFTTLKELDGTIFSQDAVNGFSPSNIGTYLNQYRVLFKSDNVLSNGSFGFKTLDFNPETGFALAATPLGLPSTSQTPPASGNSQLPVSATGSDLLSFEQYKDLLPGVSEQDQVTQQKIGGHYLLDFALPDGTPFTKLVGLPETGLTATVSQEPLTLDVGLPAGLGLSMFGPEPALSASAAPKYLNDLVDLAFPIANDYSRSIKAGIDALAAKKGTTSATKLISPEGQAQSSSIQLTGETGQTELLALNMWASSGIQQVEVSNIEHLLVVGDGMVTQAGSSPVFFTGDGANQILVGGPGNDYLYSGGGYDVLIGGTGSDTFHITRKGKVSVQDFEVIDKLQFSFLGVKSLLDLVNRITGVNEEPNSVTYVFDGELSLTLVGYSLYSDYPESMFIL